MRSFESKISFRSEYPGGHINNWDYSTLHEIGSKIGYSHIIESKPGGSISKAMQGYDVDRSSREMSLYVDMKK